MKIFEDRTYTRKVCMGRKCDLCGAEGYYGEWKTEDWGVQETEIRVEIRHKSGEQYPEAGWGTLFDIDLCPKCFRERLVPWLRSQGADVKEEEWEN